jgi:hypothetical protein
MIEKSLDISPFFSKMSTGMFFFLVFALQILLIFQGLDLSDEGFLSIFYQRIFSNPISVSYNFMFWLTGIIGGIWAKIFSPLGLLGIRLGGAIVNTTTVILTYNLLKKYVSPGNLKLGLLLVVLSLNNDIKVINYNTLSSLFYIIIVYFLFSGLIKGERGKIFMGGIFTGLNIFIRTPNILELGLVLGILFHHYLFGQSVKRLIQQILLFLTGFISAVAIVILLMYLIGHLQIFTGAVRLLFTMGKNSPSHQVTESGYGLSRLIYLFWSNNVQSLKYALFISATILYILFLGASWKDKTKQWKLLLNLVVLALIVSVIYLILIHWINHFTILFFLTGLILLAGLSLAVSPVDKQIKLLLFFGIFFLVTFPLGSSDGIFTAGRYCLWIALPVTLNYLLNIQSLNNLLVVRRDKQDFANKVWISEQQLFTTKKILLCIVIFAGFYNIFYYPFFDRRSRMLMHYAIKSENLKGIYTTKGRAAAFNELLTESGKYVKPNGYALAYDHIAMFYYATNTIPYLTNSLPSVYTAGMFNEDLASSYERNKMLPPVIVQKIGTTGDASQWPEVIANDNYEKNEFNQERNNVLDTFLVKNNYKKVWENNVFKILIPEK